MKCLHSSCVNRQSRLHIRKSWIQELVWSLYGACIVQQWTKIANEIQNVINTQSPQNNKMCKDKWNDLNLNYKKIVDYRKGIKHNIFFLGVYH
jgi:hypothetical protein